MRKMYYYDGHYKESEYTLEELEKIIEKLKAESDAMNEWEKID